MKERHKAPSGSQSPFVHSGGKQADPASEILEPPTVPPFLVKWVLRLIAGIGLFFALLFVVLYLAFRGLGHDGYFEPQDVSFSNQTEENILVDFAQVEVDLKPGGIMNRGCPVSGTFDACGITPGQSSTQTFEMVDYDLNGDISVYAWSPKLRRILFVTTTSFHELDRGGWDITVWDQR